MGIVLAPAMGPIVGGFLIDTYGWPWIFYINIPFSIAGIWMVHHYVYDPDYLKRGVEQSRLVWDIVSYDRPYGFTGSFPGAGRGKRTGLILRLS